MKNLEEEYERTKYVCFWRLQTGKVCLHPRNKYDGCDGSNRNCQDYISNQDVRTGNMDLTKYFEDVLL